MRPRFVLYSDLNIADHSFPPLLSLHSFLDERQGSKMAKEILVLFIIFSAASAAVFFQDRFEGS